MVSIVGIHQQYQRGQDRTNPLKTTQEYPDTKATREFTPDVLVPQNLIPKVEQICRKVWNENLIAVWSFKPERHAVMSGGWRPFIEQLAAYIRDQGLTDKFIMVIWHEPENDMSAEEFVSMFNQVHTWATSTNPDLLTCHAALGYRYRDHGEVSDAEAPRWRTKASIHAIDLYQGRSFPLGQILPENSAFKRWHTFVVGGSGNPWGVTERGFIAGADQQALRADTIRREADWHATDPVGKDAILLLLWDTIGTEGDQLIPMKDEASKEAAKYYMARLTPPEEPEPTPKPNTTDCPLCHGTGEVATGQTITIVKVG